jgi:hypothetical protein
MTLRHSRWGEGKSPTRHSCPGDGAGEDEMLKKILTLKHDRICCLNILVDDRVFSDLFLAHSAPQRLTPKVHTGGKRLTISKLIIILTL